MWKSPTCEVCGEEINVLHRYQIGQNAFVCPGCMKDAMAAINKYVAQPIADALWNVTDDMMQSNDPIFTDYDPKEGFGSFKEE